MLHGGGPHHSANMAAKGGRGGGNPLCGRGGGHGNGCGGGHGNGCGSGCGNGRASSGVVCQLFGKEGHTMIRCFKRFDASFTGPP
jgi:hypothetical protein